VVVVGTAPAAQALAVLGAEVGFDVELAEGGAAQPRPDDAALIVASHGKEEEGALEAALRAGVPYVALVASESRGAAVLDSLEVDAALRSRVHTPAGLQLGARTPGEIALSILAQLVQERAATRAHAQADGVPAPSAPPPSTAVDPVCGMSVPAVDSSLHLEHNGGTVYFCSAGCRAAFRKDPERYALSV
jgi:xanthine dehydrogenase accessory factor